MAPLNFASSQNIELTLLNKSSDCRKACVDCNRQPELISLKRHSMGLRSYHTTRAAAHRRPLALGRAGHEQKPLHIAR